MRRRNERRRGRAGRMVIGVFLLGLGALLLGDNLGFDVPGEVWNYWPFLLVGLGMVKMMWPGDREEREGGFWILVSGLYCWISSWGLFGLHWGSAWPIFLLAGGLMLTVEGLTGRRRDEREDVSDAS